MPAGDDLARWVDGLVEGRRGTLVQEKRERRVWRVEDDGRTWYAKLGVGSKRAEIRREARNVALLASRLLGPDVLAAGARGGGEWLVLAAADGEPLADLLTRSSAGDAWVLLAAAARAVARLHDEGLAFPDLTAKHLFVGLRGAWIIDSARLEVRRRPLSAAVRARDLAALVASLPRTTTTASDRRRLVESAARRAADDLDSLQARVDREVVRLRARLRWRHGHADAAPDFVEALRAARGDDAAPLCDAILDPRGMRIVRTLADRENRTLGRDADGRPLFYVKAFPPTRSGTSPAMRELDAIDAFQAAEIPVNAPAAHAEDVDLGSAVAVRACPGEPLDDLLRRGVPRAERRWLALRTARIWRRMREAGLRHRDAYACHAWVGEHWYGRDVVLIDLTRAGPAPWPRERWYVKDAAQLWHGAKPAGATATDAVAWLREYFRVPRLTREAKRFARKVAAKEASIAARQARKAARG